MNFEHKPVLFEQTLESLDIKRDGIYIDGTAGGGGHSEGIFKKLEKGLLICLDQDPDAIFTLNQRFSKYENVKIFKTNFANIAQIAQQNNILAVDGILLDIGVSSFQIDTPERGFSFHAQAPLDMRMSKEGESACDLVNHLEFKELFRIISTYGEEKWAKSIANKIIQTRKISPITTTFELVDVIKSALPEKVKRAPGHPARKTFQALRIAVNQELKVLEEGMEASFALLKSGGRLAVITFHSLEDRIVKQTFNKWTQGCTCPKEFPVCICGKKPKGLLFNKKPIIADLQELEENPRSRSAKLRIITKI